MSELLERAEPWFLTLVAHNWPVMIYGLAMMAAAVWALRAPTRHSVLFLYGAATLVVAYEYQKHARETIVGTTTYLFSVETNPGPRIVSQWLLLDAAPILLHLAGFAFLAGSVLIRERAARRRVRTGTLAPNPGRRSGSNLSGASFPGAGRPSGAGRATPSEVLEL